MDTLIKMIHRKNKEISLLRDEVRFLVRQLGKLEHLQDEAKINEIAKRHKIKRF